MGWKPQVRYSFSGFLQPKFLHQMGYDFISHTSYSLQKVPIIPADGGISRKREVKL